ncbi:MAG: hypothetical protein Q9179_002856 [Wetmoreana sp. 5 TL-2023]
MPLAGPRSKKSTPPSAVVPPGLSLPQDFPPLAAPQAPAPAPPKSQKKATGPSSSATVIKPIIPVLPSQATKDIVASTANEGSLKPMESHEDSHAESAFKSTVGPVPKPKPKKEASPSDTTKATRPKKNGKTRETTAARDETNPVETSLEAEDSLSKDSKVSEKRHPGKLNIEAAKSRSEDEVKPREAPQASGSTQDEVPANSTTTSAVSQPQTPVTATSQTSAATVPKNGQPRTIRVLHNLKNETVPKGPAAATAKDASAIPSRRGSLSSINPPETPASERISDNVSLTSASASRADSPPPSKVGTTAVRHATKSQQKKERQARAKQAEQVAKVDEAPVKTPVEEPVQAPIIGRKKKQKKPASKETADSTPAVTRPSSPFVRGEGIPEQEESVPSTPAKDGKKGEAKAAPDFEVETVLSPAGTSSTDQPPQRNTLNAAALFAQLQRSNDIPPGALDIFKPVIGLNHRFDIDPQSLESQMPEVSLGLPPPLTDAQNQQIDQGEPVCLDQPNNKHIIVLPDRRTLRGLTPEQASRYLALRTQAHSTSEKLHLAGHGPAPPPRPPKLPPSSTASGSQQNHFPNPFLSEVQTQSASATNASRLPQAFGSSTSANPTTYVDEAAAFIATRRREQGGGVMGVEDAEQALGASRKETEGLEKRLNALLKRNRRMVFGGSGN